MYLQAVDNNISTTGFHSYFCWS